VTALPGPALRGLLRLLLAAGVFAAAPPCCHPTVYAPVRSCALWSGRY